MGSIRCGSCGLVNFGDVSACKRCGAALGAEHGRPDAGAPPSAYGAPPLPPPGDGPQYNIPPAPFAVPGSPYGAPAVPSSPPPAEPRSRGVGAAASVAVTVVLVAVLGFMGYYALRVVRPEWKQFMPPDNSFVVSMPGEPKEEVRTQDYANGSLLIHSYSFVRRFFGDEYMVMYDELPSDVSERVPADTIFDGACKGLTDNGFEILSRREISLQGHPGVALQLEVPDSVKSGGGRAIHRIYWFKPRLYQVMVAGSPGKDLRPDGDRMFESFKVLKVIR